MTAESCSLNKRQGGSRRRRRCRRRRQLKERRIELPKEPRLIVRRTKPAKGPVAQRGWRTAETSEDWGVASAMRDKQNKQSQYRQGHTHTYAHICLNHKGNNESKARADEATAAGVEALVVATALAKAADSNCLVDAYHLDQLPAPHSARLQIAATAAAAAGAQCLK